MNPPKVGCPGLLSSRANRPNEVAPSRVAHLIRSQAVRAISIIRLEKTRSIIGSKCSSGNVS
jgi:hypothetical protein